MTVPSPRPLRLGILGAAGIAPAAVIRPARRRGDVVVSAVASRNDGRAALYARTHGIDASYGDYEALIQRDDIDIVYCALPPSEHAEWTIAALKAGKHVLCEKPFALNAGQAREMVEVASSTGRRLFEAFHDRFHPLSDRVTELAERIGPIESFDARFEAAIPFDPSSIRHRPELGGGAIMDLGCYPIHWVRTLFPDTRLAVQQATAETTELGVDMSIVATLQAGPSGPIGYVSASMARAEGQLNELTIRGERGILRVENLVFPARGHFIAHTIDGVDRLETVGGRDTYDHQLEAVVHALRSGKPLATEGEDPVENMLVIDAVRASAGLRKLG